MCNAYYFSDQNHTQDGLRSTLLTYGAGEGHSVVAAVALLSGALALGGFQAAGLGSNHQDIAPRYSGILFGITNASSSIAGCAGIMATGAVEGLGSPCFRALGHVRHHERLFFHRGLRWHHGHRCGAVIEGTALLQ